jgi:hypothetical protein
MYRGIKFYEAAVKATNGDLAREAVSAALDTAKLAQGLGGGAEMVPGKMHCKMTCTSPYAGPPRTRPVTTSSANTAWSIPRNVRGPTGGSAGRAPALQVDNCRAVAIKAVLRPRRRHTRSGVDRLPISQIRRATEQRVFRSSGIGINLAKVSGRRAA